MRMSRMTVGLGVGVLTLVLATACGRDSKGQEAVRTDAALERKVEELLPTVGEFAHLEALSTPAVRRSSAATLEAYLLERLDAEFPEDTLERLTAAYQAFGLIPDTLDLRRLLVDLLLEQAIGYYDPQRDILFVRDEAPELMLDALLVHELVHALQDQHVDLDSLMHAISENDRRTAAQAAMEGHATAAMMAWQFAQMTGSSLSAEQLPEVGPEMAAALSDPSQFPRLAAAPTIVRDPMLFVYLGGARLVQRLWRLHADRPLPFGAWLPESTEQLLHTERLLEERDSPTPMRLAEPGGGWQVSYTSDLGELEIGIYFEEHLGDRVLAARAAAGWDGDAYALLVRGDDAALVWYSAWDSLADADEFVDAYRTAFMARFGGEAVGEELAAPQRRARVERLTVTGIPVVRVVETTPAVTLENPPGLSLVPKSGR
ncbi:MAG: hypothetical protein JSV86_02900 [Gemmatimonadota bacterium]|nr:MAG: hypothetical protein JSV86_02900 [Gemmatimonadota bacterium]